MNKEKIKQKLKEIEELLEEEYELKPASSYKWDLKGLKRLAQKVQKNEEEIK